MKLLFKIFLTAVLVMLISHFMNGILVKKFSTSIIVAIVLGLLNIFVKPILILFTLPVTIFTLGLFLLIINATIILICDRIVGGFSVDSFLTALIFSMLLSVLQSIMYGLTNENK